MYITISSIKRTLGKYIEFKDVYILIPSIIIFLIFFAISSTRLVSLIFISIIAFMMIPINLSKKNRMYKVIYLSLKYFLKSKKYIYLKKESE